MTPSTVAAGDSSSAGGGCLGPEGLGVYVWGTREARFSVEAWDDRG